MTVRFLNHYIPLPILVLAGIEIALFAGAPLLTALWLPDDSLPDGAGIAVSWVRPPLFAFVCVLGLLAVGLYNPRQRFRFAGQFVRVMVGLTGGLLVLATLYFLLPAIAMNRESFALAGGIALVGSLIARMAFERLVDLDPFKRRVLVYGAGRQASSIAALRRRSDQRGFRLVGYVPATANSDPQVPEGLLLTAAKPLSDHCRDLAVHEIVVAMDDRRQDFPLRELLECRLEGVEVTEVISFLERETGRLQLDVLNPSWMIFSEGFQRGRIHAALERGFDLLACLALLTVTWPFMLLIAVAIKIEDGAAASVLYRQQRVGQFGRHFPLLKFRSMAEGAEQDGEARWAEPNDSRTTRIGTLIRKFRLDELPQIFNVLRGDMSLVGPRPERPEFVVDLEVQIPFYSERHNLKPGITGWAQLCYPYGSSEKDAREKLQYDLYYVKNHTLLFYLAILVQTFEVVFWGKGAR